jgi:hypothetical protein
MSETILQEIIDEGKVLWADVEMVFEDYIVPLAKKLATDEATLLVKTLETEIANMQGAFTLAKLSALVPDIVATMTEKGVVIVETDVLVASAAIMAKIDALTTASTN